MHVPIDMPVGRSLGIPPANRPPRAIPPLAAAGFGGLAGLLAVESGWGSLVDEGLPGM